VTRSAASAPELVYGNADLCRCHDKPMDSSLGDGVAIGSCRVTGDAVIRVNPRTGKLEWLNGCSPWDTRDAP